MNTRHYKIITSTLKEALNQITAPYHGQPVTARLAAAIADEIGDFSRLLKSVVDSLGTDSSEYFEPDLDWFASNTGALDTEIAAITAAERLDRRDDADEHRAEYLAFLQSRRNKVSA